MLNVRTVAMGALSQSMLRVSSAGVICGCHLRVEQGIHQETARLDGPKTTSPARPRTDSANRLSGRAGPIEENERIPRDPRWNVAENIEEVSLRPVLAPLRMLAAGTTGTTPTTPPFG